MPSRIVFALYGLLVVIWSSTWVAIRIGLHGTPPLLGAGIRFTVAGLLLLAIGRALGRRQTTDVRLAVTLACLPFAATYALIYWAEQYIPSGLTAVLFGALPLYVGALSMVWLREEPVHPRFFLGVGIAMGGLVLAFGQSVELGHEERAGLAAGAVVVAALAAAVGSIAIKRRGAELDALALNGWAMLGGGLLLLAGSGLLEAWGEAEWTAEAVGAIAYLAILGTALGFVVLTLLLRELRAVTMSYLPLMVPFGALVFGWALEDEALTAAAIAGAGLVASGLAVAQPPRLRPSPADPAAAGVPSPPPRTRAGRRSRPRG